jgi:alanyl-tRNA synthetase
MNNVEFEANIIEEGNDNSGKFVILDHTQFYPDGKGGQLGDRGTIEGASVVKVVEMDSDKIVHYVDEFPGSRIVRCQIDGKRRRDISIQHTAQHILSGSFLKLSGIETVGFHMSDDYTTVDLDAGDIDESIVLKAEFLANEVVLDNREVKKYYVSEADLDRLNIRKKEDIGNRIRIVEIDDFDLSMCGGTHVNFTGEIGIIKIIKREKIKKTNTRLFFVAGERALIDYEKKLRIVSDISNFLTTGEDDIFAKVHSLVEENRNLYKEIRANQDEIFKSMAEHLSEHAEMVEGIKYI